MTQHYSTEFLYFPLNQGQLPAGSYSKPKFNISSWDYLDDKARFAALLFTLATLLKYSMRFHDSHGTQHWQRCLPAATCMQC